MENESDWLALKKLIKAKFEALNYYESDDAASTSVEGLIWRVVLIANRESFCDNQRQINIRYFS